MISGWKAKRLQRSAICDLEYGIWITEYSILMPFSSIPDSVFQIADR
jgi:hypothetical protein